MFVPQSNLFEVFPIDFLRPLQVTAEKKTCLLICAHHLTSWPIVKSTVRATAEEVRDFVEQNTIFPLEFQKSS